MSPIPSQAYPLADRQGNVLNEFLTAIGKIEISVISGPELL